MFSIVVMNFDKVYTTIKLSKNKIKILIRPLKTFDHESVESLMLRNMASSSMISIKTKLRTSC